METKEIKIPILSEAEYDAIFEEIKTIPNNLSSDEVLKLYKEKLPLPAIFLQEYDKEARDITRIYRVRVQKEDEVIDLNNPAEFSYPPAKFCQLQRCNFSGQAVFYGAIDPFTTFIEAKKAIIPGKSIIFLSQWGIKDCPDPLFCQRIFYGLPETDEHAAGVLSAAMNLKLKKLLSSLSENELKRVSYFLKKYQELFTSPGENYYHITASVVNDIFKNWHGQELGNSPHKINVPIFSYPSVAQNLESMNYAITTEFVDKYMYLKYVDKVIIQSYEESEVKLHRLERGMLYNGVIKWVKNATKLVSDPYFIINLFKGDNRSEYRTFKTDDLGLKLIIKGETKTLTEYLESKISMNDIQEFIVADTKKQEFDFTQGNSFERTVGIIAEEDDFFISHPANGNEKIGAVGIEITYSSGYHFEEEEV